MGVGWCVSLVWCAGERVRGGGCVHAHVLVNQV